MSSSAINPSEAARRAAEAAARQSYGKLVAFLAARSRDVAAAEDALADAFAAALADWPRLGCPEQPEAWLLTVARRRLADRGRRQARSAAAAGDIATLSAGLEAIAGADELPDRRLGLMFACAHPAIDPDIRAPLMLQAVLGLPADIIASAFLTSPAAMAKRLVRAKTKIRDAGIPFSVPAADELSPRLEAVLDAIYAGFGEGWNHPADSGAAGRELAAEALFLAKLTAALLPDEPEALGLHALMLYAESRRQARRDGSGEFVPFAEQDPALWDHRAIAEAEAELRGAARLGAIGCYQLEAAIQSAHVERRRSGVANWAEVVMLYDGLLRLTGSCIVALNRALAVAERDGPEAGLAALPDPEREKRLLQYQPYFAARADLLARCGRLAEAALAYDGAAGLSADPAIRRFLAARKAAILA